MQSVDLRSRHFAFRGAKLSLLALRAVGSQHFRCNPAGVCVPSTPINRAQKIKWQFSYYHHPLPFKKWDIKKRKGILPYLTAFYFDFILQSAHFSWRFRGESPLCPDLLQRTGQGHPPGQLRPSSNDALYLLHLHKYSLPSRR
jgi:hypothetical protein